MNDGIKGLCYLRTVIIVYIGLKILRDESVYGDIGCLIENFTIMYPLIHLLGNPVNIQDYTSCYSFVFVHSPQIDSTRWEIHETRSRYRVLNLYMVSHQMLIVLILII